MIIDQVTLDMLMLLFLWPTLYRPNNHSLYNSYALCLSLSIGGARPGHAGARAPAKKAVPRLVPRLENFGIFQHYEVPIHYWKSAKVMNGPSIIAVLRDSLSPVALAGLQQLVLQLLGLLSLDHSHDSSCSSSWSLHPCSILWFASLTNFNTAFKLKSEWAIVIKLLKILLFSPTAAALRILSDYSRELD